MSIYGNLQSVNEGIFLSKESKGFIDGLKNEIKALDYQGNFKDKAKTLLTTKKYNQERFKKVQDIIKSKFKKVHITSVVVIETTTNGAKTGSSYVQYVTGTTPNNKIISFGLVHLPLKAKIYGIVKENSIESNIPMDIYEKTIDIASPYSDIVFKKNKISFESKVTSRYQDARQYANKLVSYINQKYSDKLEAKVGKISNNTVFIKSK